MEETIKDNLKRLSIVGKKIIATEVGEPIKTLYGVEIAGGGFGVIPKFYYFDSEDKRDQLIETLRTQEAMDRPLAMDGSLNYMLKKYTMKYYRDILGQKQVVSKKESNGDLFLYAPTEEINVIKLFDPKETLYSGEFVWKNIKGRLKEELEEFQNKGIPVDMNFTKKGKKTRN